MLKNAKKIRKILLDELAKKPTDKHAKHKNIEIDQKLKK